MINAKKIIKKLKGNKSLRTDEQLAEYLGVHFTTLSGWKKRNTINIDLIMEKFPGINMNWLLYDEDSENYGNEFDTFGLDDDQAKDLIDEVFGTKRVKEKQESYSSEKSNYSKIPVYHGVSAGEPTQHYDSPKEFIRLDHIVNKNYVGITVNTSDYKDYGFEKGDILLVDTMRAPMNENLVLIDINNSYGLFVYLDKGKDIEIKNFNDGKINQFDEDMTVIGVVVSKMKKLL